MIPLDLAALRKAALKAEAHDPGEWYDAEHFVHSHLERDAAEFIEQASPATALALLDRLDQSEERAADLKVELEKWQKWADEQVNAQTKEPRP